MYVNNGFENVFSVWIVLTAEIHTETGSQCAPSLPSLSCPLFSCMIHEFVHDPLETGQQPNSRIEPTVEIMKPS